MKHGCIETENVPAVYFHEIKYFVKMAMVNYDNPSDLETNSSESYCHLFCTLCPKINQVNCIFNQLAIVYSEKCKLSKVTVDKISKWVSEALPPQIATIKVYDFGSLYESTAGIQCHSAQCQIIIITKQSILDAYKIISENRRIFPANRVIRKNGVALLLDVESAHVADKHDSVFPMFKNWQSIHFYTEESKISQGLMDYVCGSFHVIKQKNSFNIVPNKLFPGQDEIVILFDKPIQADEQVVVVLSKGNNEIVFVRDFQASNPFLVVLKIPETALSVTQILFLAVQVSLIEIGKVSLPICANDGPATNTQPAEEILDLTTKSTEPGEFPKKTFELTLSTIQEEINEI